MGCSRTRCLRVFIGLALRISAVAAAGSCLVDCGATSLVGLRVRGIDPRRVDAVILSHLHGDHFGGLPFLLLDAQFLSLRQQPLLIAGPPGTRARLDSALEVMFPGAANLHWRFSREVVEAEPGYRREILGHSLETSEVVHLSGAPSTALRLSDGQTTFAYSGDTEWTEALLPVALDADLFVVECFAYAGHSPGHMSWHALKPRLPDLRARQVMVTHMGPAMLNRIEEMRDANLLVAEDGKVIDF